MAAPAARAQDYKVNVPRDLYYILLKAVNPERTANIDEDVTLIWVEAMAIVRARNGYPVQPASYPGWAKFERAWSVNTEFAEDAMKPREEDAASYATYLNFQPFTLFKPLRLFMLASQIRALLGRYYTAEEVATLMEDIEEYQPAAAKELDKADRFLAEAKASALPARETNSGDLQDDVFARCEVSPDVLAQFIKSFRPISDERSVVAVERAAKIAAVLKLEMPRELVESWPGKYSKVWSTVYSASLPIAELAADLLVGEADVAAFLDDAPHLCGGKVFAEIADRNHLHHGIAKFLEGLSVSPRSMAMLYMRWEGYGQLLRKDDDVYWQRGAEFLKIRKNGRTCWENWQEFQNRVREVLGEVVLDRHQQLATKTSSAAAETATSEMKNLIGIIERLDRNHFMGAICAACLEKVVLANRMPELSRVFPKLSPETEKVILKICDKFGEEYRELPADLFDAYCAACSSLGLSRRCSADALCRELYKQRESFEPSSGHKMKYVCGLHLKRP